MKAFEVQRGERVLFAFTHPDDELTVVAFVRRLLAQGIPIHICWTHSTPVRERESRSALSTIGVREEDMTFFDAPDGKVVDTIELLKPRLCALVRSFAPSRVVTHAFEQGHIDHDATNLLVNMCFDGPVFETPFYHTYLTKMPRLYCFSNKNGEETIQLTPEERRIKKRLVCMYPSQTVRRNVVAYELAHAVTMRKPPLFQYERLRRQQHTDFLTPNHPPMLAKRVAKSRTWKRWTSTVRDHLGS
jgi:LmbE family N-acetylglucosaminyl deacetylase